ncbi:MULTISPECIES: DUF5018-related domain-containing protein [Parabacteroides]|uniref:DUF5018-related domain-containing protein n=1 Tax=Parabacteroides TaxID=375288 RepID=UPI00240DFA99|nr:hypothetical protein [Parabacteroides chongii]WFE87040.1 hypothetical protein P3L47_10805 [Parabacteroides chongii]
MKKVIYNLLLTLMMFSFTSCLTSGLDELDVYDGADITSVSAVAYRYISDEKSPASGQNIVKEVNLTFTSDIDTDAATVKITVSVPENFPEAELGNLSTSNIMVAVGLSTAARISPLNGSPTLGVPGDWSKPNTYVVDAANGTRKNWTIEVMSLMK